MKTAKQQAIKNKYPITFYRNKYFKVKFWNIVTKELEYVGQTDIKFDAVKMYSEHQYNFYEQHTYLLPKFISIDRSRNGFIVIIRHNKHKIHLGRFLTIEDAKAEILEFVNNIIY